MRKCDDYQELLSYYLDDCLEATEKAELEKHLKECPQCQYELEALQQTINLLSGLQDEELVPPASFRRELRQKLEKEQKKTTNFYDKFFSVFKLSKVKPWMPMVVAVVLLLIIVPSFLDFPYMGSDSVKELAQNELKGSPSYNKMKAPDGRGGGVEIMEEEAPKTSTTYDKAGFQDVVKEEAIKAEADIERKIIKTGHMNLEVDNYKDTLNIIKGMVRNMHGYIVNENTYIYDREHNLLAGDVAFRIPYDYFEKALDRLEETGSVKNRSVDAADVTEEYVDTDSRLKAMRIKEERLLSLLNKSGNLGDVLAVENELARTRADIEALEGRLRYLNNRTDLSTINVNLKETLTPIKKIKTTGFQGVIFRAKEAFIKSINTIIIGCGNMVVYIGAYLPFVLIMAIVLLVLWFVIRKRQKKE